MIKFSVKNVFRKKGIAILSSAGIAIGLMLMFVLGAFSAGVNATFEENFSKVLGIVEITEKNPEGGFSKLPLNTTEILLDSELGDDILAYSVKLDAPFVFTSPYTGVFREGQAGDILSLTGLNLTLDKDWNGPSVKVETGRNIIAGKKEILLDSRLLSTDQTSFKLGDQIIIYQNISPIENQTVNFTVVGTYFQEESGAPNFVPKSYNIYTSIEDLWTILGSSGRDNNTYSSVDLRFPSKNNNETNIYIEKIEELSNEGAFGDIFIFAFSLGQFQEGIQDTLSIFDTFTSIISLITAIAGGMSIVVSQLSSVSERKKEFAILKSTGWKNSHIFKDIVYESLTLGIMGAIFGVGLGFGIIQLFSSGAGPFGAINAVATPLLVLEIIGFGLSIGIIGGFYPGLKAARVRPVIVLKGD